MADKKMKLQVITPERIFFDGLIDMVIFSGVEGEMAVLYDHIPLTTLIESTLVRLFQGNEKKIIAVHSGFIEIKNNKITLLTDAAEWPHEIDVKRAEEAKERAEKRLQMGKQTEENLDIMRAEIALKKSITRIQAHNYLKK